MLTPDLASKHPRARSRNAHGRSYVGAATPVSPKIDVDFDEATKLVEAHGSELPIGLLERLIEAVPKGLEVGDWVNEGTDDHEHWVKLGDRFVQTEVFRSLSR